MPNTTNSYFPLHKKMGLSSQSMMFYVLLALIPGTICQIVFFGFGIVFQLLIACLSATIYELLYAKLNQNRINSLNLITSLVSSTLLAISIPALLPWYLTVIGVLFALFFGKTVYGGVGMNIFNPAMVGLCFLYLSFPSDFLNWPNSWSGLSSSFNYIFLNQSIDAISSATVLQAYQLDNHLFTSSHITIISQIFWAIGGIWLCIKKIADWRLVIYFLASCLGFSLLFYLTQQTLISPINMLLSGAIVFSAWFIITDPTTAATSNLGKVVYAIIVGGLVISLRVFGVMPDTVAFAILIGNLLVPLIDTYTRPNY